MSDLDLTVLRGWSTNWTMVVTAVTPIGYMITQKSVSYQQNVHFLPE